MRPGPSMCAGVLHRCTDRRRLPSGGCGSTWASVRPDGAAWRRWPSVRHSTNEGCRSWPSARADRGTGPVDSREQLVRPLLVPGGDIAMAGAASATCSEAITARVVVNLSGQNTSTRALPQVFSHRSLAHRSARFLPASPASTPASDSAVSQVRCASDTRFRRDRTATVPQHISASTGVVATSLGRAPTAWML